MEDFSEKLRTLGVPELGLSTAVSGGDLGPRPNAWLLPKYNRRELLDELREVELAHGFRARGVAHRACRTGRGARWW